MLKLEISKRAGKQLKKLPAKQGGQIASKITQLMTEPDDVPTIELKGYAPWRRAKSGEYRIIYKIEADTLYISLIGKRNDDEIYRLIERFLR